jgi:hypothetical protein
LIKRGAVIESDKKFNSKFNSQIRVISLEDSSPYETMHSYVANTLAPYFKSYIKRNTSEGGKHVGTLSDSSSGGGGGLGSGGGGGSGGGVSLAKGMPMQANMDMQSTQSPGSSSGSGVGSSNDQFASLMEKKIAEVEMGLLHLQQNIDIPEINLIIHPTVAQIVKKCTDEQRKPRADDYSDKAEDANFLNQLQSGVSRWIREIKKVARKSKKQKNYF